MQATNTRLFRPRFILLGLALGITMALVCAQATVSGWRIPGSTVLTVQSR